MSVAGEVLRDALGHGVPELGELVAGQPPVEDAGRVVHLAVAEQVHDRGLAHGAPSTVADAAARAACGSASATREIASSSCAAERNHDSYADGGR